MVMRTHVVSVSIQSGDSNKDILLGDTGKKVECIHSTLPSENEKKISAGLFFFQE